MFENWYLTDLLNEDIKEIWPLTDKYLLQLIKTVLDKAKISEDLKDFISIEEIIRKHNYIKKAQIMLTWDLERLKYDGYVETRENKGITEYCYSKKNFDFDSEKIYNDCYKQDENSIYTFKLLSLIADNYEDLLKGTKKGIDLIYSPNNIHIINEYYDKGLFYNVNNVLGAKVLNYEIDCRNNPTILELGGGLGGGTKQFILQRKAEGNSLTSFHYHFTDIANSMLRKIKRPLEELAGSISNYEFSKFDFNKPLHETEMKENRYDIIWAVNAIHVAYDLKFTLSELYKLLKPEGVLLIVETVRPMCCPLVQHEFVINTLDDYTNIKLDESWRPSYGFMRWNNWTKALEAAGFDQVNTVPDMEVVEKQYNNCYTTVIRGIKK